MMITIWPTTWHLLVISYIILIIDGYLRYQLGSDIILIIDGNLRYQLGRVCHSSLHKNKIMNEQDRLADPTPFFKPIKH